MSAIVIDGKLVHYEAVGRGKPVVFLHGWLGSWRYWMHTMEELSSRCRCYAFDFWGFGDTERRPPYTDLNDFVAQLDAFLEDMGIWRFSLISHGLGAVVGARFAGLFPQRIERFMAVSLPIAPAMLNRKALVSGGKGIFGLFGYRWNEYPELAGELGKTDPQVIEQTLDALEDVDIPAALSLLDMPVLLVYGRKDPMVKPLDEALIHPKRYNTRVIHFEVARHFPMLEERSKFIRLMKDFFEAGDDLRSLELKQEWRRRTR